MNLRTLQVPTKAIPIEHWCQKYEASNLSRTVVWRSSELTVRDVLSFIEIEEEN